MVTRGRRPAAVVVLPLATLPTLLLGGCSISTTTTPGQAPTSTSPTASSTGSPSASPTPELDLQLRPVLDVATATAGQCTATPPPTPPAADPAQLCTQDRTLVLSLGPAAVTGEHVTGLDATMTSRRPQLQVKLDAVGGAALTRVTAEGMLLPAPRNQLALVSHGRVQSAPTITDVIDGNVIVFTGFATVEDAQAAADFLAS